MRIISQIIQNAKGALKYKRDAGNQNNPRACSLSACSMPLYLQHETEQKVRTEEEKQTKEVSGVNSSMYG
jgi:hypothetical protein